MRVLIILLAVMLSGCGTVDTGSRGIWVKFGEVVGEPISEGLYFYNPFVWDLLEYPVREEKWTEHTQIFTRDTQQVDVEFTITFHVVPGKVGVLYREIGTPAALGANIIRPVVLGSIKDSIGQVIADNLVGERERVTKAALKEVTENLVGRHVEVTDLQLTNINFDDAYEKAVEMKVVAIQDALRAKNETVKIKEQAAQTVMSAQAEAEAMKIKSAALSQNKGLIAFEWVQKWDGKQPQIVMGGSSIPMLDMGKLIKAD